MHSGGNNEVTENPKGTLQERVLALGVGIQAKQIRYWEKKVRGDQWQCTLDVAGGGTYKSNPKGSKKIASSVVAMMALTDWDTIERVLRRHASAKNPHHVIQEQEVQLSPSQNAARFFKEIYDADHQRLNETHEDTHRRHQPHHKMPPLRVKPIDTNVSVMYEQAGRLLIQAVSLALDARNAESKGQKPQQSPGADSM